MATNDYIVSPGGAAAAISSPPILTLTVTSPAAITGPLAIPSLKDATVSMANDVFTFTQLNKAGKRQVPTTATNSIATNLVVESETFFGATAATAGSAAKLGILGLSTGKTKVHFTINIGDKTLAGDGYVTALAPTVSADAPVWVTPVTITIDGDIAVT